MKIKIFPPLISVLNVIEGDVIRLSDKHRQNLTITKVVDLKGVESPEKYDGFFYCKEHPCKQYCFHNSDMVVLQKSVSAMRPGENFDYGDYESIVNGSRIGL